MGRQEYSEIRKLCFVYIITGYAEVDGFEDSNVDFFAVDQSRGCSSTLSHSAGSTIWLRICVAVKNIAG